MTKRQRVGSLCEEVIFNDAVERMTLPQLEAFGHRLHTLYTTRINDWGKIALQRMCDAASTILKQRVDHQGIPIPVPKLNVNIDMQCQDMFLYPAMTHLSFSVSFEGYETLHMLEYDIARQALWYAIQDTTLQREVDDAFVEELTRDLLPLEFKAALLYLYEKRVDVMKAWLAILEDEKQFH